MWEFVTSCCSQIFKEITITANTKDLKYLFSKRQLNYHHYKSRLTVPCSQSRVLLLIDFRLLFQNLDYLGYGNTLVTFNLINVKFSSLHEDLVAYTLIDNHLVLEVGLSLILFFFTNCFYCYENISSSAKNQVIITVQVSPR